MDLRGTRVFLVEDDGMIAMLVESVLGGFGCEVIALAGRLDDAVEQARTIEADVALLDINLAGQMSYPVAAILRLRGIPFLFATSYGAGGLPEDMHGSIVLSKPFPWHDLQAAIGALVEGSARVAVVG